MNIDTIQMDPRIARLHYLDYRKRVRAYREERAKRLDEAKAANFSERLLRELRRERSQLEREDEQLMESYRAMSQGARIVNVASAILKAGASPDQHLPRLALARADWLTCWFDVSGSEVRFQSRRWSSSKASERIILPRECVPAETWNVGWRNNNRKAEYPVRAIVPTTPVHLRPEGDLGDYHILWEAHWDFVPPLDPLLLRHISGHHYAVLAQWDLTPLERSVLEGRIGS